MEPTLIRVSSFSSFRFIYSLLHARVSSGSNNPFDSCIVGIILLVETRILTLDSRSIKEIKRKKFPIDLRV